jgi:hypothetical protein
MTARIDPNNKPCTCYGAPINPVWRSGNVISLDPWATAPDRTHIGYECGRCGHRWPFSPTSRQGILI